MTERITELARFGRPLVCTEYMAPQGRTSEAISPRLLDVRASAQSAGACTAAVRRRTWPGARGPVLPRRAGGVVPRYPVAGRRPYRQDEVDLIRAVAGRTPQRD